MLVCSTLSRLSNVASSFGGLLGVGTIVCSGSRDATPLAVRLLPYAALRRGLAATSSFCGGSIVRHLRYL